MKHSILSLSTVLLSLVILMSCSKSEEEVVPLVNNKLTLEIDGQKREFEYSGQDHAEEFGETFRVFGFTEPGLSDPDVILIYIEDWKKAVASYPVNETGDKAAVAYMKLSDYVNEMEKGWGGISGNVSVTKIGDDGFFEGSVSAILANSENKSQTMELKSGKFRIPLE